MVSSPPPLTDTPTLTQTHTHTHTQHTQTHNTHTPSSSRVTPQLSAYESNPAPRLRSSVDRVYGNMLILSSGIYTDTILLSAYRSVRPLTFIKQYFVIRYITFNRMEERYAREIRVQ